MSVIFIALPIALLLAGAAVCGFIWAVRGGQFDDLDSPPVRVVMEEDEDAGGGGLSNAGASHVSPLPRAGEGGRAAAG